MVKFGHDKLFGGVHNDQIYSGRGDDLLRGGLGRDILRGDNGFGRGRDSFVLAADEGTDTIADFNTKFDELVLVGGLTPESLSIIQQANNTIVGAFNKTLAVLNNVNANQLIAADVFTIA